MLVYQKHAGDDAKLLIKFHWPKQQNDAASYLDGNPTKGSETENSDVGTRLKSHSRGKPHHLNQGHAIRPRTKV